MSPLWSTLHSWLSRERMPRLRSAHLLREVAEVAERLRRVGRVDLAWSAGSSPPSNAEVLGRFSVAVERVLGWTPFDVQVLAAAAMADGRAVEMQTGEGKTLATAAAAALLGCRDRRVHVATVNRYLAHRDFERFAPVLQQLGLSVGFIHDGQAPDAKREAYARQIVFGTGYEFGFDYLREQLRRLQKQTPKLGDRYRKAPTTAIEPPWQPNLDCVLIDELDSVLLDEATVPLVLSEPGTTSSGDLTLPARAEEVALALLERGLATVDGLHHTVQIQPAGHAVIDDSQPREKQARLQRPWRQYVEHALTALALLQRDVDYVVADRKIWLVDASTGRIFADRRWQEGLQHALEFKERLPLSQPMRNSARITRQRFFKLYRSLGGTSGTLAEAADEIRQTYGLPLRIVAHRLPSQREEWPTRYFVRHLERLRAAAEETAGLLRCGRPILVGCRTIAAGREAANVFSSLGIVSHLLDGTQTDEEARIIGNAGRAGTVTIATNLAGRGTDIVLDETARRAGGLHVLGIERHDSRRVDRQLLGRAGRQGDPGSGRFFVSGDDALLRPFPSTISAFRDAANGVGELQVDLGPVVVQCQAALEAEARLRRCETAAGDVRLDDLLATLAKSE